MGFFSSMQADANKRKAYQPPKKSGFAGFMQSVADAWKREQQKFSADVAAVKQQREVAKMKEMIEKHNSTSRMRPENLTPQQQRAKELEEFDKRVAENCRKRMEEIEQRQSCDPSRYESCKTQQEKREYADKSRKFAVEELNRRAEIAKSKGDWVGEQTHRAEAMHVGNKTACSDAAAVQRASEMMRENNRPQQAAQAPAMDSGGRER